MDIKELETFLTLVHTGSYPQTAEILNFAPSTLSHHIQVLERELGKKLFRKTGKGLEPTQEGWQFAEYARGMVELYETAMRQIGGGHKEENVSIGGCELVLGYGMMKLFSDFSREYPQIGLSVHAAANSKTPETVRNGAAEIGIFYTLHSDPLGDLYAPIILREPICVVASADNPLSRAVGLGYEQLEGVRFALPHDDCYAAVELLRQVRKRGVKVGQVSYLGMVGLMLEKVRQQGAVIVAPRSAARNLCRTQGLAMLDLREEPVEMYGRVLCRNEKELTSQGRLLLEYCLRHGEELLDDGQSLRLELVRNR